MNFKIVTDSSCNIFDLEGMDFSVVPMQIINCDKAFIDDTELNIDEMAKELIASGAPSSTSCPSVGAWLDAFGEAEGIFAVTITGALSGSYNSAVQAADIYMSENPDRKVCVIDSKSTGPACVLLIEKLRELILSGADFEDIEHRIRQYQKRVRLLFVLSSAQNLANNGRCSKLVASAIGILGVRLLGQASEDGELVVLSKCRGAKKALLGVMEKLQELGCHGGKLIIHHRNNLEGAKELAQQIKLRFPRLIIDIKKTRGLCSFYAEEGGLLIGFEA